jgi:hypothetical protein
MPGTVLMGSDRCVTGHAFDFIKSRFWRSFFSRKPVDVGEEREHRAECQNNVKKRRDFYRYPHCVFPRTPNQTQRRPRTHRHVECPLLGGGKSSLSRQGSPCC